MTRKYEQVIKKNADNKIWKNTDIEREQNKNKPRRYSIASFHLNSEHDCLAAHLKGINIFTSEECRLCHKPNSKVNKEHLLHC